MSRPVSRAAQTLQDYGTPGTGTGAEKSTWQFWVANLTAANLVAQLGLISALKSATLAITRGSQSGTSVSVLSSVSAITNTDPLAQRENKWLVRYHDSAPTKFTLEIPTADLALLTEGTEFLNLADGGPIAAFVTAFQAVVVSPDDPTLSVTVDSIQFVGRRN